MLLDRRHADEGKTERYDSIDEPLKLCIVLDSTDDLGRAVAGDQLHRLERSCTARPELTLHHDSVIRWVHHATVARPAPGRGRSAPNHPGDSANPMSPSAFARRTASSLELTPSLP